MEIDIKVMLQHCTTKQLTEMRDELNRLIQFRGKSVPITEIRTMSMRLRNILTHELEITDLMELTKMESSQFKRLRGVGVLSYQEATHILDAYDLAFKVSQIALSLN